MKVLSIHNVSSLLITKFNKFQVVDENLIKIKKKRNENFSCEVTLQTYTFP